MQIGPDARVGCLTVISTINVHEESPQESFFYPSSILFFLFSFISLIADGPHHYHPSCGHKRSSHLSPVHALHFFIRFKFSTLTTRQPMVEFNLLTFPRFPLRKKEHKSYFGKNRTHGFRTSRCAAYLLDHSGDNTNEIPNTVLDVWKAGCIHYLGKVGSRSSEVDRKMLSRIVGCSIRSTLVTNY